MHTTYGHVYFKGWQRVNKRVTFATLNLLKNFVIHAENPWCFKKQHVSVSIKSDLYKTVMGAYLEWLG